ncbi:hypothetical protein NJF54_24175 [Pseudomonas guariconensis]|uniref:hypothetical protein n=1 Tax=Pseudomonas TaxID=286 RepID=UPI001CE40CCE|nr:MULTISPECIES: hypothetical protein [Pseudomonas]MCO7634921.1 hypothetical protein [Pseudomonas guariconensis]
MAGLETLRQGVRNGALPVPDGLKGMAPVEEMRIEEGTLLVIEVKTTLVKHQLF